MAQPGCAPARRRQGWEGDHDAGVARPAPLCVPRPGRGITARAPVPAGPPPLPLRLAPATAAWPVLAVITVTGAFLISEPRPAVAGSVRHTEDLALCGRGALCPR